LLASGGRKVYNKAAGVRVLLERPGVMKIERNILWVVLLVSSVGGYCAGATITVDTGTEYQTMIGWEATTYVCEADDPAFPNYKDRLFDLLVNDIGINRVRVEIRAGVENDNDNWTDYRTGAIDYATWRARRYATVNDNGDPCDINWDGYHFSELDYNIDNVVLPMKQLCENRGENLYINLNYVAFTNQISGGIYIHDDAQEYAEFMLAAWLHLDEKYGWTPDALEIILEPANVSQWSGTTVGNAMVATLATLHAHDYNPNIIVPSNPGVTSSIDYFNQLLQVPGAAEYVSEYSYHLYWNRSDADVQALANQAAQYGMDTSMLEWWDAQCTYERLHKDLTLGMNSAWQPAVIRGLFDINDSDPQNPTVAIAGRTKFWRQYFKYVRLGAARVAASSDSGTFAPIAWVNENGKAVVVVKAGSAGSFSVQGIPAGIYGIKYTWGTNASNPTAYDVDVADVQIGEGGTVSASIPGKGVITIYEKTMPQEAVNLCKDGVIDEKDLAVLAEFWLGYEERADVFADGIINFEDVARLANYWYYAVP
jgi:hypothetical protein